MARGLGTEVRLEERRHGVSLLKPLGKALLLAGAGGLLLAQGWPFSVPGALLLAVGALLALRDVWRWERTRLIVTADKLFLVEGTLRRRAAAVRLARVDVVELEQSLAGRVLGYGTLVAGGLEIPYVSRPREVCRLIG